MKVQVFQDLGRVRALSALFSIRQSKKTSIEGGNIRLVNRLIKLSGAELRVNSTVIAIEPGLHRRYRVSATNNITPYPSNIDSREYDAVIIAAPLYESGKALFKSLGLDPTKLRSVSNSQFMDLHVTFFTSLSAVPPQVFNLPGNISMPDDLVFTNGSLNGLGLIRVTRGEICYWYGCYPGDECDTCEMEFVYGVILQRPLDLNRTVNLLGHNASEGRTMSECGIRWIHRQFWPHALPIYRKDQPISSSIKIAPNLLYLNGAEDIISSIEMSCLMGRNAANWLFHHGLSDFRM